MCLNLLPVPPEIVCGKKKKPNRIKREYFRKLPKNTKSVTRPGKFGNPFKVVKGEIFIQDIDNKKNWLFLCNGGIQDMLFIYKSAIEFNYKQAATFISSMSTGGLVQAVDMLTNWINYYKNLDFSELEGKNLACFCKLHEPCHADILLNHVHVKDGFWSKKKTIKHVNNMLSVYTEDIQIIEDPTVNYPIDCKVTYLDKYRLNFVTVGLPEDEYDYYLLSEIYHQIRVSEEYDPATIRKKVFLIEIGFFWIKEGVILFVPIRYTAFHKHLEIIKLQTDEEFNSQFLQ